MVRAAIVLGCLALGGCALAWEAADPASSSASGSGGTSDQVIEVPCAPLPADAGVFGVDGIVGWHDFMTDDPEFQARVTARAKGQLTSPAVYWKDTVAYASCGGPGVSMLPATVAFVVLP